MHQVDLAKSPRLTKLRIQESGDDQTGPVKVLEACGLGTMSVACGQVGAAESCWWGGSATPRVHFHGAVGSGHHGDTGWETLPQGVLLSWRISRAEIPGRNLQTGPFIFRTVDWDLHKHASDPVILLRKEHFNQWLLIG